MDGTLPVGGAALAVAELGRLMPMFDAVSLFHLGEFRSEANDAYGGHTDYEVLRRLCKQTKVGGLIAFYAGSNGWGATEPLVAKAVADGLIVADGTFKTLPVYKRTDKPTA